MSVKAKERFCGVFSSNLLVEQYVQSTWMKTCKAALKMNEPVRHGIGAIVHGENAHQIKDLRVDNDPLRAIV